MRLSGVGLKTSRVTKEKIIPVLITGGLWIGIAWLLYPLVVLESLQSVSVQEYMYRSGLGILIMLILFGKNVFDMFMPQAYSGKVSPLNSVLLMLYTLFIGGTIVYMVSRLFVLYFRALGSEIDL